MKDIMNSNIIKVGAAIVSLYAISSLYKTYQLNENNLESDKNNVLINDYLLSEITEHKLKKPILWIHIPYKINSRNWESFYSRSNENINQPYIYICIKSIIDLCGNSFHVCIIDDDSFQKLIPNWKIDMSKISEPVIDNIRKLAFMKLLYNYGGMFVPYSFVCYKDLISLYNMNSQQFFVGEFKTDSVLFNKTQMYPNYELIGSVKNNQTVFDIIKLIEINIHNNTSDNLRFEGTLESILYEKIEKQEVIMINGELLGTKQSNSKLLTIEDLFSEKNLTFNKNIYGIYLPNKEILKSTHYNWFSVLDIDNCIQGDLNIFYILKKAVNQYL